MSYYVFTLKFLSPVHFGSTQQGGGLEKAGYTCGSDTLFSALCQEAALQGENVLQKLLAEFADGGMKLSSLFPYFQENEEDLELYLPKPLCQGAKVQRETLEYDEMKAKATENKKLTKLAYVRVSELQGFLQGEIIPTRRDFAAANLAVRVNCRGDEPLPYYVKSYSFINDASITTGLYCILEAQTDEQVSFFRELLNSLGYTGIGGKRSSGCGKFILADDEFMLDSEACVWGDDDLALAQLLEGKGNTFMSLSAVHPAPQDIGQVKQGSYKLSKRSGFVEGVSTNLKRQSVHMLVEGSCLPAAVKGELVALQVQGVGHPVYRYGMGMYIRL